MSTGTLPDCFFTIVIATNVEIVAKYFVLFLLFNIPVVSIDELLTFIIEVSLYIIAIFADYFIPIGCEKTKITKNRSIMVISDHNGHVVM